MKKFLLIAILLCAAATVAFAQPTVTTTTTPAPAAATAVETITLTGDVIDNMCADANKDNLAAFVATHAKQCALSCADSGYAIFAEGKLTKFDQDSNAKVAEYLKKEDSKLQVVVTAKKIGEELSLVSIENQK